MWTETTVINPQAWSPKVEADLAGMLEVASDDTWFVAACESARSQLEAVVGPHHVTINGDGSAALDQVPDLDEMHAANERWHEERRRQVLYEAGRGPDWSLDERVRHALDNDLPLPRIGGGAAAPSFSATPNVGSGLVSATLDTSLTAPTNITTILTAGSGGTQIFELVLQGVGTVVAGIVNIFRHDGSTYHLYDQALATATTSSTTANAFRTSRQYTNLILKSGDTLRVAQTVAGNQSLVKVTAHGGDL